MLQPIPRETLEPLVVRLDEGEFAHVTRTLGSVPAGSQGRSGRAAAETRLKARRLIATAPDGTPQVDQTVVALVGTCLYPSQTLRVSARIGGTSLKKIAFHHFAEMTVEHAVEADGEHVFTAYGSDDALLARLCSVLNVLSQPAPAGLSAVMPIATLEAARAAAANDDAGGVVAVLRERGVGQTLAGALGAAMSDPAGLSQLVLLKRADDRLQPQHSLTVLEGNHGFWTFSQMEISSPEMDVQPMSAQQLSGMLRQLLEPLSVEARG